MGFHEQIHNHSYDDLPDDEIRMDFLFSEDFMNGRSIGDDLIENVLKSKGKWYYSFDGELQELKAIVDIDDSGTTQPAINLEINGIEALLSDLTLSETEVTGDINISGNYISHGDNIEITVSITGDNGDAEDLTVYTSWKRMSD